MQRHPDVQVGSRVVYYDVEGSTAAELVRSMTARGPEWEGRSWGGLTHTHVTWSFATAATPAGCLVRRARVRLEVETTLPRWTPPPDAPRALVYDWGAYVRALRVHEDGHADVAVRSARELRDTLAAARTASCEEIRPALHAAAARAGERHGRRHREYDAATRHGHTQGAVPPRDPTLPERIAREGRGWLPGILLACVLLLVLLRIRRR